MHDYVYLCAKHDWQVPSFVWWSPQPYVRMGIRMMVNGILSCHPADLTPLNTWCMARSIGSKGMMVSVMDHPDCESYCYFYPLILVSLSLLYLFLCFLPVYYLSSWHIPFLWIVSMRKKNLCVTIDERGEGKSGTWLLMLSDMNVEYDVISFSLRVVLLLKVIHCLNSLLNNI